MSIYKDQLKSHEEKLFTLFVRETHARYMSRGAPTTRNISRRAWATSAVGCCFAFHGPQ